MYFAHGAVHAPLQAKSEDIEKYKGKYDAGWDELRKQRFERQQELGVVSDQALLPDRNFEPNHAVKPWDELTSLRKGTLCPISRNYLQGWWTTLNLKF